MKDVEVLARAGPIKKSSAFNLVFELASCQKLGFSERKMEPLRMSKLSPVDVDVQKRRMAIDWFRSMVEIHGPNSLEAQATLREHGGDFEFQQHANRIVLLARLQTADPDDPKMQEFRSRLLQVREGPSK
jgi:hypothetical protein